MTTAYTSLLGLALPVTGELSGTWGDTVNNSITSLLDSAVAGTQTLTADTTLTTTTGAANQSRQAILLCSPASANITITAPAQSKIYTVINTSATYTVTVRGVGPTTGVTLGVSEKAVVAWNGSDFVKISNTTGDGTFANLTVTGNTSLGDTDTDTITQAASYVTGTQLKSAKTATNTLNIAAYDTDGAAYTNLITLTASTTPTLALTSTGVGTINNMSVGATTASTGAFTTLSATGNVTLGDASTDTVTVNGYMGVGGAVSADNGLRLSSSALTGLTQHGVISIPTISSAATTAGMAVSGRVSTAATAFTVTNVHALYAYDAIKGAGSTITNQHGLYIVDQTQGTNNYGITSLVSSGTNKWNIYASGTADNYFAGDVGIGTSSPVSILDVAGTTPVLTIKDTQNKSWVTGDTVGDLDFYSSDTSGTGPRTVARIRSFADGTNTTVAGALSFWTSAADSAATEKMRLTKEGNLGIGTTTINVSGLEISRATGTASPTPAEMRLTTTSSAGDWSTTSPWGRFSFYSADTSEAGPKIQGSVDAISEQITGGRMSMAFSLAAPTTGTLTERMRIDSAGEVGIGTTNPEYKLDVQDDLNGTLALRIRNPNAGSSATGRIIFNNDQATNVVQSFITQRSSTDAAYPNALIIGTVYAHPTVFLTSSAERMRIDSSGNVAIGATSAAGRLLVVASDGTAPNNTTANGALKVRSTATAAVGAGPSITFEGQTGNTTANFAFAGIQGFKGSATAADYSGVLAFYTQNSLGSTALTERMRIDVNGYLLVGTTASQSVSSGNVAGNIQVENNGSSNITLVRNSNNASSGIFAFGKSRGTTFGSRTIVASGDVLGSTNYDGADGTNFITAANIFAQVDGTPGTNDMPGRLCFGTTADGASSPTERMRIDSSGNVLVTGTGTGSLGYGTGSGGTVTQGTSRTTGVTLSKPTGAITMFSAAGSATAATFTVTNTLVAATDTIILNQKSGTNLYVLLVTAVAAGSFNITFYTTGGVATDAPVINFALIKGVTA